MQLSGFRRRAPRARLALSAAAAVALATGISAATVATTSAPASAAVYSGKTCTGAPSVVIGTTMSLYTKYGYYGSARWHYGTSGSCAGYQWIVNHVTKGFYTKADNPYRLRFDSGLSRVGTSGVYAESYWDYHYISPGYYTTAALYSASNKDWGYLNTVTSAGNSMFYGHDYTKYYWSA
jgi:hypothetical protein